MTPDRTGTAIAVAYFAKQTAARRRPSAENEATSSRENMCRRAFGW